MKSFVLPYILHSVLLLLTPRFFTEASNFNFFDDSILYKINWPGISGYDLIDIASSETLVVTTHHKEKYKCVIPKLKEKEKGSEEEYNGPNALELLLPLFQISSCASRLESYWTYEICHGKYVKQFHEEREGKKVSLQEYYLGRWDKFMSANLNEQLDKIKQSGQPFSPPIKKLDGMNLPYLQLNFTDGTVCDLNGKPRETNVLYVCYAHGKNEIYSIKETSTCVYEVIVLSAMLCQHPKYRPEETGEHDISCLPIDNSPTKPLSLQQLETESLKQRHFKTFHDGTKEKLFSVYSIQEYKDKDGRKQVRVELLPLMDEEDVDFEADLTQTRETLASDDSALTPPPLPIPLPVLDFLSGRDCLRGGSGWWKFKFCYGQYVEQYHIEKGPDGNIHKTDISLGVFNKNAHLEWIKQNPHKRPKPLEARKQFSQYYGGGRICENTGRPRETEVKLKCSDKKGTVSLYLLEPNVCQYELGIESPLICQLLDKVDDNSLIDIAKLQEKP